jgi:hypothetical protein
VRVVVPVAATVIMIVMMDIVVAVYGSDGYTRSSGGKERIPGFCKEV